MKNSSFICLNPTWFRYNLCDETAVAVPESLNPTWFRYNHRPVNETIQQDKFKSHMVQIQQGRLVHGSMLINGLNPTWFRYNRVCFIHLPPKLMFKSHMVQIQLIIPVLILISFASLNPTWFRYNKKIEVFDHVKAQV